MAPKEEMTLTQGMKIAQISKESGLTRSTIHHYVNIGLLHRPQQVGLNLHLFDETHLNRLRQIRRLRENEGLPLAHIKELLDRIEPQEAACAVLEGRTGTSADARSDDEGPKGEPPRHGRKNREMILDAAIKLFSERGYENTKISDITDTLHMGKGTFYVYFKNKKELFMECIDRLTVTIVPKEAWAEIRSEKDFVRKARKRGVAFLDAFPGFRGILNLLRIALGGRDPALARKAKEAFRILSAPLAKDLRRATSEGVVRSDIDVELLAYLELVLAEGIGYWLMMDPRCSVDKVTNVLIDLFGAGLARRSPEKEETAGLQERSGSLKDKRGVTVHLKNILVGGNPYLTGRIGEGGVELDLAKASRLEFSREGTTWVATAGLEDGSDVALEVEGETNLSGQASFGSFRIPLKSIASIDFKIPRDSHAERRRHGNEEE